ncbi:hypothetical protein NBRC116598_22210 [Pseudophaeobacter arcticus]|uniref:Uncharacterized protein n=1 Tax=Pseudophaeobacter arcticus TaxID=385492 RepID=A0ABQ0ALN0_9RHOB
MLPPTPIASRCNRSSWGWRRAFGTAPPPTGGELIHKLDDGRERYLDLNSDLCPAKFPSELAQLLSGAAKGGCDHLMRSRRPAQILCP